MDELLIESHGAKCKLIANEHLIRKILYEDFLYHYIPDIQFSKSNKNVDVIIQESSRLNNKAKINFPKAFFRPEVEYRSVISTVDYLLERVRQERYSIYCLNSSTASLDNQAVTFWGGATNLGKTSSMLELILKNNFDFYSDERTLLSLNNKSVIGGSRSIATRKKILKEKTNEKNEFYNYNSAKDQKKLKLMIYPHLDHGLSEPIVYRFESNDFNWLLLREFGVNIRGAIKYIDNYSYSLPSLDTQKLANKRTLETKEFTLNVPCYYFQGSLSQITSFINNYFKEHDTK
jgi:hypothetical protein